MGHSFELHVWGDYGLFTRPEMKAERVSYDVMTPSAARGVFEAILWKPQMRWRIRRIRVLNPIRFESIRRNEVASKISERNVRAAMARGNVAGLHLDVNEDRQQRAAIVLKRPAYVVEAAIELTGKGGAGDPLPKYEAMFERRARQGQCFHRPYLGAREFAADFALVDGAPPEDRLPPEDRDRDLGWMLYDLDYEQGMQPVFFRARLEDGTVDLTGLTLEDMAR